MAMLRTACLWLYLVLLPLAQATQTRGPWFDKGVGYSGDPSEEDAYSWMQIKKLTTSDLLGILQKLNSPAPKNAQRKDIEWEVFNINGIERLEQMEVEMEMERAHIGGGGKASALKSEL